MADAASNPAAPRFAILDGLRGVAAIAVVFYHFGTRLGAPVTVPHGHLAVDFFFMLSGFVLTHSYASRLDRLGFIEFARRRLIRLWPMAALGLVIGATYLLLRWKARPAQSDELSQLIAACALNFALLPKLWHARTSAGELYPANGNLWSLFLELVVNFAWGALLFRARTAVVVAIVVVSGAVMALSGWFAGTENLGWSVDTLVGGLARACFGYFVGVLIYRYRPKLRRHWGPAWAAVLIVLAVMIVPARSSVYEIVAIIVVLPAALYLAASAEFTRENAVVTALGDISYPLYAIHLPLLGILSGLRKSLSSDTQASIAFYAVIPVLIAVAWVADRFIDRPARSWLTAITSRPKS